jgi:hypothetical protein
VNVDAEHSASLPYEEVLMSVRTVAAAAALAATALFAGAGTAVAGGHPDEVEIELTCNQFVEQEGFFNTVFGGPVCIDFGD